MGKRDKSLLLIPYTCVTCRIFTESEYSFCQKKLAGEGWESGVMTRSNIRRSTDEDHHWGCI